MLRDRAIQPALPIPAVIYCLRRFKNVHHKPEVRALLEAWDRGTKKAKKVNKISSENEGRPRV